VSAAKTLPQFPARALYVVEFQTFDGWVPMPGDAYLDEPEAQRVAKRAGFPTRVVCYVPEVVSS